MSVQSNVAEDLQDLILSDMKTLVDIAKLGLSL